VRGEEPGRKKKLTLGAEQEQREEGGDLQLTVKEKCRCFKGERASNCMGRPGSSGRHHPPKDEKATCYILIKSSLISQNTPKKKKRKPPPQPSPRTFPSTPKKAQTHGLEEGEKTGRGTLDKSWGLQAGEEVDSNLH